MLITVVTVCLNCEDTIESTIKSVLSQKYSNFEYLIIDGKSTDSTLKIIDKYKSNNKIKVISESDKGIYDAMNKATKLASGEYIYYLNSGDYFENENVLENVAKKLETNLDIYYGNIRKNNIIEKYPSNINNFYLVFREKMVCHQAIFAKRKVLLDYPFDINLRICADRDWMIRCIKNKKDIYYMNDIVVANYDCNGQSSVYSKFNADSIKIAKKYGGFPAIIFIKIKRFFGKIIK